MKRTRPYSHAESLSYSGTDHPPVCQQDLDCLQQTCKQPNFRGPETGQHHQCPHPYIEIPSKTDWPCCQSACCLPKELRYVELCQSMHLTVGQKKWLKECVKGSIKASVSADWNHLPWTDQHEETSPPQEHLQQRSDVWLKHRRNVRTSRSKPHPL